MRRRNMLKSKVLAVALSALMGVTCMPNAVFANGVSDDTPEVSSQEIEINKTNFPDDNFRAKVESDVDRNNDGKLSQTEIKNFTTAGWFEYSGDDNLKIKNTKGIEYLTGLRVLLLEENDISSIDLTNNKNLEYLSVANNQIRSIDVSQNEKLQKISLSNIKNLHLMCNRIQNFSFMKTPSWSNQQIFRAISSQSMDYNLRAKIFNTFQK